jgi:RNA polymerase sigma-70 factor, ECF subfamily
MPLEGMGENQKELVSKILFRNDMDSHLKLEEQKQTYDLVHGILNRLSPEDRMVLRLVHIDRYSAKEAAELLGWSRANVLVRAHRSRKRFRRILESEVLHA